MKNSIACTTILIFFAVISFNQNETYAQKIVQKKQEIKQIKEQPRQMIAECIIKRGNKLYHFKNGKEQLVRKEIDFYEIKVMPDGSCKMKNGKIVKLNDGDCCDQKGEIHKDCDKILKRK